MKSIAVPELLVSFVVVLIVGTTLWAIVDIVRRPTSDWKRIGQSQTLWLAIVLFVSFFGPLSYLIAVRPKLELAAVQSQRPLSNV